MAILGPPELRIHRHARDWGDEGSSKGHCGVCMRTVIGSMKGVGGCVETRFLDACLYPFNTSYRYLVGSWGGRLLVNFEGAE